MHVSLAHSVKYTSQTLVGAGVFCQSGSFLILLSARTFAENAAEVESRSQYIPSVLIQNNQFEMEKHLEILKRYYQVDQSQLL